MKTRLDRNLPFGEIFGAHPTHPTAKYTQNGLLFTGDGQVILNEDEKRELAAKMRAELAALEGDVAAPAVTTAPLAPLAPIAEAALAPVQETQSLPTEPALTPQQKAAATRAANKANKLGTGALPPLPE